MEKPKIPADGFGMKYVVLLAAALFRRLSAEEDLEFSHIDVASLATNTYGTELLLLENSHYTEQKAYKFEDFFWTGSGDGSDEENPWTSEGPAVIYKTSTVITTVFVETASTQGNTSGATKPAGQCVFNCTQPSDGGDISPTPTLPGSSDEDASNASQQFWLLTVLKGDGKDPVIIDLKNSLAKLYRVAFQRQQARHLGIITRQKRDTTTDDKPVHVYIHEVNRQTVNGENKIDVVYHVEMLGKPVDAHTAASDMKLVSDEEVTQELGFPFEIKAEPYVKASEPMGLAKAKNTWFVIGISIIGVLLILLVLAFLLLGMGKKKRPLMEGRPLAIDNKRHIFERGVGVENKGLVPDDEANQEGHSPTYINFGEQHVTSVVLRPQSSLSPTSSSSSSLDISPLMSLGKKRKTSPKKKPPRPRAALNKTVPLRQLPPEVFDSDSGSSRKEESPDYGDNYDPGVVSPKSFLSMPSVKSFPRTNMPEPLNRVLEPVSVTNLDMPDGSEPSTREYRKFPSDTFIRHGSVGTMEDPGIIGPVVWKLHSERLKQGLSVDQGINDFGLKTPGNISRMRKRFHDLLDDTFSLFSNSRKASPVNTPVDDRSRPVAIEVKSHSANDSRPTDLVPTLRTRPKTTGAKHPYSTTPTFAWSSTAPSPLIRPVSAAPKIGGTGEPSKIAGGILKQPRVNVEHVLAEGKFRPSDPAITVIEAIKTELEKVSLPGSSSDLNK